MENAAKFHAFVLSALKAEARMLPQVVFKLPVQPSEFGRWGMDASVVKVCQYLLALEKLNLQFAGPGAAAAEPLVPLLATQSHDPSAKRLRAKENT